MTSSPSSLDRLFGDRLELFAWEDHFPRRPLVIPLSAISRVALADAKFRIYYGSRRIAIIERYGDELSSAALGS